MGVQYVFWIGAGHQWTVTSRNDCPLIFRTLTTHSIFFTPVKVESSPYINHFLQPDSLIPDPSNPQAWNRYSYVGNNPVNANDPSGHKCVGEAAECLNNDGSKGKGFSGGDPKPRVKPESGCGVISQKRCDGSEPTYGDGLVGPQEDVCKTFGCYKESDTPTIVDKLNIAATLAQDAAVGVDLVFALVEIGFMGFGCSVGGPEGCLAGIGVGQVIFNTLGGNALESVLGGLSLLLTGVADFTDDGEFGDATATSLLTASAGAAMPDPIGDLLIDGYGSAYNHGYVNGIEALMNGASLFKQ